MKKKSFSGCESKNNTISIDTNLSIPLRALRVTICNNSTRILYIHLDQKKICITIEEIK